MKINLPFDKQQLVVELPEKNTQVIESLAVPALPDEKSALQEALCHPLGTPALKELARPNDTVAIVFSDLTRPIRYDRILPVLLEQLSHVPPENIVLINALGIHRRNTPEELRRILGDEILAKYRVISHDAAAKDQLTFVGTSSYGQEIWINSEYMNSSVHILTGAVQSHVHAGFSGGPKSILPGIAGKDTIVNHHSTFSKELCRWGTLEGNLFYEQIREAARMARVDFILNVTMNQSRQITGVFAGNLDLAHKAGIDFLRESTMHPISELFDIAITTGSGYPYDRSLHTANKGMSIASQLVKEGGAIVVVAACPDGLGNKDFREILKQRSTLPELLHMVSAPDFVMIESWNIHTLAEICSRYHVHLFSPGHSEEEIRKYYMSPCHSVEETLKALLLQYGTEATICVLPEGPAAQIDLSYPSQITSAPSQSAHVDSNGHE